MSQESESNESPPQDPELSGNLKSALESEKALRSHYEELLRSKLEQKAAQNKKDVPETQAEIIPAGVEPSSNEPSAPSPTPNKQDAADHSGLEASTAPLDSGKTRSTGRNESKGEECSTKEPPQGPPEPADAKRPPAAIKGIRPFYAILILILAQLPWAYFFVVSEYGWPETKESFLRHLLPKNNENDRAILQLETKVQNLELALGEANTSLKLAEQIKAASIESAKALQAEIEALENRLLDTQRILSDNETMLARVTESFETANADKNALQQNFNEAIERIDELEEAHDAVLNDMAQRREPLPEDSGQKKEDPLPILGKDGWVFPPSND